MAETLSPTPRLQFLNNDGKPLVGGKLFTYSAGTSTKLATYTDSGGGTPNSNPVILDFRGEANIWIPPNVPYKYVLAPPNDTDPPGSPIWTVDNIVNSQLLTLYAGVDTGIANSYILTFSASFTAYEDGIILYWIPSNTNTGSSTLNVNGLGQVAIVNPDGSALGPGQVIADQITTVAVQGGEFILLSASVQYAIGAFTGTITGFSATITGTVFYSRVGNTISLHINAALQGANSNSTGMALFTIPSSIRPSSVRIVPSFGMTDNGVQVGGWATIATTGLITFSIGIDGTGSFTASGVKGLRSGWNISYPV